MAPADPGPMVAQVIECACGEQIGVSVHPATSYEDGRDLGPLYLTEGHGRPFGRTLWRVGTGDAGAFDQRCPGCATVLPMPEAAPEQLALG